MALLAAWVLFPAVALVLCLGCGLLLERAIGRPLRTLLAPAGFAVVVVVSSLTTMWPRSAPATAPIVVALAVAGLALGRRRPRPELAAVAACLGAFAVYAAPIVLSGSATFAGYITLDDTATWLALADNALAHGRSISGLPPSTYSTVLNDYLSTGYPLGAFLPLGIGHVLTHQDSAWLFQPQIAFLASMLALALYSLTGSLLRRRALRAAAAFLGAQAALLYGYAFWSGIKEVTAAVLVALAAALLAALPWSRSRPRDVLPLAIVAAALLDTDAVVGSVWFAAFALAAGALLCTRHRRRVALGLAALVPLAAAFAAPALTQAHAFLRTADGGAITSSGQTGLGNLIHPLSNLQVLGIWPAGDFRDRPPQIVVTDVLLAVLVAAGLVALAAAIRRREWGLPLVLAVAGCGAFAVVLFDRAGRGSPWLDGKALATASPAFVLCGAAGCGVLLERRGTAVLGAAAAAAVATGVLWSNALAYADVWLAPRSQLSELETIGKRYAGDGPTLMTEYQPYGVRHFLRDLDPEGASERRYRPVLLRNGSELGKAQYADIDAFALSSILVYRTLVLRGSPTASRPPSSYQLVWTGGYYEVWQRKASAPKILEHLSLGSGVQPDSPAPCGQVEHLAALAAASGGELIASERPQAIIADLSTASHPARWAVATPATLIPDGGGTVTVTVDLPARRAYGVWLGGSFRGTVTIAVDGVSVGSRTAQYSETAQAVPFGSIVLGKGRHTVTISYRRDRLRPGEGSYAFGLGPLELGVPATQARLVTVPPDRAATLCGRSLDWIEAVSS